MRIIFGLMAVLFFAVPAKAEVSTNAYDRVIASGTIRCAYGISPPNLVMDPNTKKLSGLDYDVWQEIGKDLGLKIQFVEEAGWGNFIEGLKANRYDAFCSSLWPDPGRIKNLSLTVPLTYSLLKTYVRADDHRFDGDLEKINSETVTIPAIEGDVSVDMATKRFPKAKVLALPQMNTVSDMFMSVVTKKADVIFLNKDLFESMDKENKGVLRELKDVPNSYVFASYFGVKSGEIQLRDMINISLETMIDDGRLEKIIRKYGTDNIAPAKNF